MKPVNIKGQNVIYAKDQPEYFPLPGRRNDDGVLTTCWKLSCLERMKALITGRIFLCVMTFNKPLQPVKLTLSDGEL